MQIITSMNFSGFPIDKTGYLSMKKLIITALIVLSAPYMYAADLRAFMDSPLLNPKVQENELPFGEYSLVRSYRNTTQLLVSVNTKIVLYTDRDNMKDSEVFVTAYSRLAGVILNVPALEQHEFDLTVERLIRSGDSSSAASIPFPGGDKFIDEFKRGAGVERSDGEYFIYLKENSRPISLMTINQFWKKLTIRNVLNENKIPSNFYSIYIDECYDRNIKKIIREYSAVLKKLK